MHDKHFLHENIDQLQSNILQKTSVLAFAADRSLEASGVPKSPALASLLHWARVQALSQMVQGDFTQVCEQ